MPDLNKRLDAINKWLQRDIHSNCGCGNCHLIEELKKDIEFLKQKVKDCELYMTDFQKWKMYRDRDNIERDLQLERCD